MKTKKQIKHKLANLKNTLEESEKHNCFPNDIRLTKKSIETLEWVLEYKH